MPCSLALASEVEDSGRFCADRGNTEDAAGKLSRRLQIYIRVATSRDASPVRRHPRSLRSPGAAARRGLAALTDSELAVAGLVVQSLINREVAARLFGSPHTVHTHLRHVFEKLKLNSRGELASVAACHGSPAQ